MHKICSKIASKIITPRSLLPSTKLPGNFQFITSKICVSPLLRGDNKYINKLNSKKKKKKEQKKKSK